MEHLDLQVFQKDLLADSLEASMLRVVVAKVDKELNNVTLFKLWKGHQSGLSGISAEEEQRIDDYFVQMVRKLQASF